MARIGALSGQGEILIAGVCRGHVRYAIDECHQGGLAGRQGRITGDDALLQAICEHAFEVLLSCPAGRFTIHLRSYVVGRGSAVVAVGELGLATSRSAAA